MSLDLSIPPKRTKYNFLSLGAGVQSSTLALMAANGEVEPMPDAAIFADTRAEPASVYRWLDWLEKQLPFPVHRVDNGSLTDESLRIRVSKKTGINYISHSIPAFIKGGGKDGTWFRQCTERHKLSPLNRVIANLASNSESTVWIGISWDELQRMRESTRKRVQHRWPLIERRMTRFHCIEWMAEKNYPTPPRSSCIYCPYHSNSEWRRLRDEEPEAWQEAIIYEKRLQEAAKQAPRLDGIPYLHPQRIPLEKVDLDGASNRQLQLWNSMQNECAGMCGV